jgi:hypothetical protein
MTAESFERSLRLRLCWLDGFPTTKSSGHQRQCPHCRSKWSYRNLERQWDLTREYCLGRKPSEAARRVGLEAHAAGRFYGKISKALAETFIAEMVLGEFHFPDTERADRAIGRLTSPQHDWARDRMLVQIFLADLPVEKRCEMVFQRLFRNRLRQMVEKALGRKFQPRARVGRPKRPGKSGRAS